MRIYWMVLWLLVALAAHAEPRHALIIGNGDYPVIQKHLNDLGPLSNPRHDAEDMADLLQTYGFTLVDHQGRDRPLINASKPQMDDAADLLLAKVRAAPNGLVIVYFSGHGVYVRDVNREHESANYLLPVGVRFSAEDPAKIKGFGVNAHNLQQRIEDSAAAAKLMILDACREKLELRESKGFLGGGEFRPMNPLNGMMVVHATLHSYRAWGNDRARNSRFTGQLLAALRVGAHESLPLVIGSAIAEVEKINRDYPPLYRQYPLPEGLLHSKICLGACDNPVMEMDLQKTTTADHKKLSGKTFCCKIKPFLAS